MPGFQPTPQNVHIDYRLTDAMIALFQAQSRFAVTQVAPIKPVKNQTNFIVGLDKADLLRNDVQIVGPNQPFPSTQFQYTDRTYACANYGLNVSLSDLVVANQDAPVNTVDQAIPILVQKHMIKMESVFAASALQTGVWGTEYEGVASSPNASQVIRWSDKVNATILDNVYRGKEVFSRINGVEANVATTTYDVFRTILTNPEIKNQVKAVMQSPGFKTANTFGLSGGPAAQSSLSPEGRQNAAALAMLFGLDALVVTQATSNTAAVGAPANYAFVGGGGKFLLTYNPGSLGLMDQCSIVTFAWTNPLWQQGRPEGTPEYFYSIRSYRWEIDHSQRIDLSAHYDVKVLQPEAGVFFYDLIA